MYIAILFSFPSFKPLCTEQWQLQLHVSAKCIKSNWIHLCLSWWASARQRPEGLHM